MFHVSIFFLKEPLSTVYKFMTKCTYMRVIGTGAVLGGGGRVQGPPPPPTRLSNTTGILQKKKLCGLLMLR